MGPVPRARAALIALAVLASACVQQAAADSTAPTTSAPPPVPVSLQMSARGGPAAPPTVISDGVDLVATISWDQTVSSGLLWVESSLRGTLRLSVTADPTRFDVSGQIVHDPVSVSCTWAGRDACDVVRLADGEVSGSAVRDGDVLTVRVDWQTYGTGGLTDPVAMAVDAGAGVFGVPAYVRALEEAHVVGGPLAVDLASGASTVVRHTGLRASGSGLVSVAAAAG